MPRPIKPARVRTLSEPDRSAWADYVRQVKAFEGRDLKLPDPPAPAPVIQAPAHVVQKPPAPASKSHRPVTLVTGLHPAGLDKSTWNRFSGGKLPATRTLDLHGKTADAAFHALQRFLLSAHAEQVRCVEIITGRGSGEHGGVIRRELPHWLNAPALRPLVLAASHPHALNPGSTRLLLRRIRSP